MGPSIAVASAQRDTPEAARANVGVAIERRTLRYIVRGMCAFARRLAGATATTATRRALEGH
jgi:hypothetical protein